MDFITHSLVGAGVAKLLAPRRKWVPQLTAAGLGASLLQDADSWLYLLGPNFYGKYHRVASHNLWGLLLVALVSAWLAWGLGRLRSCRRFGWFVATNLDSKSVITRAPWLLCFAVAILAAYLHLALDLPTGFGNLVPLWPWSSWDASLHAVCSFDWVIFGSTFGWHLYLREAQRLRGRHVWVTLAYAALIAVYVALRLAYGERTVW